MALVPVIVGIGSFIAGYATSQYNTEIIPVRTVDNSSPVVQLFTDSIIVPNTIPIPVELTLELNTFDKSKLKKPDVAHSPTGMMHALHKQITERREFICGKKNEDEN